MTASAPITFEEHEGRFLAGMCHAWVVLHGDSLTLDQRATLSSIAAKFIAAGERLVAELKAEHGESAGRVAEEILALHPDIEEVLP